MAITYSHAAQQIALGDYLPLQFLKLFAPAMLILACRLLGWPGSALAHVLGSLIRKRKGRAKGGVFFGGLFLLFGVEDEPGVL